MLATHASGVSDNRRCFKAPGITRRQEVSWPKPPVRVDLKTYLGEAPVSTSLEFSADGRLVCVWWLSNRTVGDYKKLPGRTAVFDVNGKLVEEATDASGQLQREFIHMFPDLSWRRRFAEFVQDTNDWRVSAWGFAPDGSLGARFLKPAHNDNYYTPGKAQLWRFAPTNSSLWSVELPKQVDSWSGGRIWLCDIDGKASVMLAFFGIRACVLSETDGALVDAFTYGKPDTEAEAEARARGFGLIGEADDVSHFFTAGEVAVDTSRNLIACGDAFSRRVRVLAIGRPHKVVFEANAEDNPERPRGGNWSVTSLQFGADGQYLVVGYRFGGRFTEKTYYPIEVYETRSWRLVWRVNGEDARSYRPPSISPDGKAIALVRATMLEIGAFAPKPQ